MMSAITTIENQDELTKRLSAWCVIENDKQRFNFRFPDTRRLPTIFDTLTLRQRGSLAGPAINWSYVDRDGKWKELALPVTYGAIADRPRLDDDQFAAMVNDSEVDEAIDLLQNNGPLPEGLRSEQYATVNNALRLAREKNVDPDLHLEWCDFCLKNIVRSGENNGASMLAAWRSATNSIPDKSMSPTNGVP
jgi:hypothetical protein